MDASRRDAAGRIAALSALAWLAASAGVAAQEPAVERLSGTAFLADAPMTDGVVVLHHITGGSAGEVDSARVDGEGGFTFDLPTVPDPTREEVYFASLRHDGVLYFGPAIGSVIDLDEAYEIHAYDTLLAPLDGVDVTVQSRSVFFEPDASGAWYVTDLFQLRNERDRTVVSRPGGRTWSYPLPPEAEEVRVGEGELSLDVATFEDGDIVVRAALPPGERVFIARYVLASPYVALPTPGLTEELDVLFLEPVPPLEIEGLEAVDRVEMEAGATFRRYGATEYDEPSVVLGEGESEGPPPVQLIAVLLALALAAGGLLALRGGPARAVAPGSSGGSRPESGGPGAGTVRERALLEIARLDEAFQGRDAPSEAERSAYRERREALMRALRGEG